ncbi:MAG TPA: RHS repeat-associated core domain-containing protein, partial [Flavobacterium sp.]|nr:RHS repeat-associated core domain-containing protein [Flavobacterium sp.]
LTVLDRGYTGHEHLQSVGIINMNGRIYDPKLHRFLSPDNHVQDPYNTQNYNRYGYCWNNPLKFTDPSGEVIGLGAAVLISAAIAATTYTVTALLTDIPFTPEGLIQSAVTGAISGAVTFGIGQAMSSITQVGLRITAQALAHGTFQGSMAGIQGGDFLSNFAAGAISSVAASFYGGSGYTNEAGKFVSQTQGLNGIIGGGNLGMIAFGTVSGGAGAALTGGNFWQGATTGLIVSGLNHALHGRNDNKSKDYKNIFKTMQQQFENGDGYITIEEAHYTYMLGKGKVDLNAQLNKLDLSKVRASHFKGGVGSRLVVNFASSKYYTNITQAVVYGNITLELMEGNMVFAPLQDKYNFDLKLANGTFKRDFLTLMGIQRQGGGTPFYINLNGTTIIKP